MNFFNAHIIGSSKKGKTSLVIDLLKKANSNVTVSCDCYEQTLYSRVQNVNFNTCPVASLNSETDIVVLDSCLPQKNLVNFVLKRNKSLIATSQHCKDLPILIRNNIDFVFVFKENYHIHDLYNCYFQMVAFKEFDELMISLLPFEFIFLDKRTGSIRKCRKISVSTISRI
jgi:hypothetical protein